MIALNKGQMETIFKFLEKVNKKINNTDKLEYVEIDQSDISITYTLENMDDLKSIDDDMNLIISKIKLLDLDNICIDMGKEDDAVLDIRMALHHFACNMQYAFDLLDNLVMFIDKKKQPRHIGKSDE